MSRKGAARVAEQVREFHAPYWQALTAARSSQESIQDFLPHLRKSLTSLIEQGYTLTDIGMMLGLTRERIRQYAGQFGLPKTQNHAMRVWDEVARRFVALPVTVGQYAQAQRTKAFASERQSRLSLIQERFWKQVDIPLDAGCWIWRGFSMRTGRNDWRGVVRGEFVHRISFLWANGFLPLGRIRGSLIVSHICDNGLCVNPDHLELMTHKENIQDSIRKGRHSSVTRSNTKARTAGLRRWWAQLSPKERHDKMAKAWNGQKRAGIRA